jgi:4-hydroxythreonine-4-phosphate dehydrogenase
MSDAAQKPLLAITLGDPAGVGPEVVVKAWSDPRVHECCRPVALGHPEILRRAVELTGSSARVEVLDSVSTVAQLGLDPSDPFRIPCLPVGSDDVLDAPPAKLDPRSGQAAYEAVVLATRRAIAGQFAGLVTAPLSKAALHAAGHHYPGHTELLAELCGVDDFAMMLYLPKSELPDSRAGLGVVHTTLHCAIRTVPSQLTPGAIAAKCRLANAVMRDGFGLAEPRIGVCALNPHAGEDRLFGDEEERIIAPAVGMARADGICAAGPMPADTLMVRARDGEFDAVVAMYHDQGHIALKLLGMHRAVNITLGLPIVRTSVAHGTAFDRAWQGSAESTGMVAAILAATELARRDFRFR